MRKIKFDYSKAIGFINQHEVDSMQAYVDQAHKMIHEKTGAGNDFLGWIDLPVNYDKDEFERIKKAAEKIKADSDVLNSNWNRWILLRSKSCYRNVKSFILEITYRKKIENHQKYFLLEII